MLCRGLCVGGVGSVTEFGSKVGYVDAAQGQVSQWRRRVAALKTEQGCVATGIERSGAAEADLNDVESAVEKRRSSDEHGWIRAQRQIDREFSQREKTHGEINAGL